jgi:hypothetical protein
MINAPLRKSNDYRIQVILEFNPVIGVCKSAIEQSEFMNLGFSEVGGKHQPHLPRSNFEIRCVPIKLRAKIFLCKPAV